MCLIIDCVNNLSLSDNVELAYQGDNIIRTRGLNIIPNPGGLEYEIFTNYFRSAVVFVAALILRVNLACFNPNAHYTDMECLRELVKPKVIFSEDCDVKNLEKIRENLNLEMEIVVFGDTEKHISFDEFLKPFPKVEEDGFEPYQVEDLSETAIIAFSSGSTGTSKGLSMHHFGILSQLAKMSNSHFSHIGLTYSALAWVSGQVYPLIHTLTGNTRLICSAFTSEKTLRYLNKYPVVTLSLPPQDAMLMLKHGNPDKIESPYLQMVVITGGKMSVDNMSALGKIFSKPVLVVYPYGQSEIYGPAFSVDPGIFTIKPHCVGKPILGFSYKIVDPVNDKVCGPNEQDELCIKSRFCTSGYYNLDSCDRFDSDGFLRTGDVAYYDEEHCFYIVERLGERLKYKSQWIPPALLEGILYEHPAVKVACIIGIVAADGDIATAVVVKKGEVSEDELVEFVNERVDDIKKIRGGVIFVEDSFVPYTFSGKIRRFLLRKRIIETYGELIKSRISSYINAN